MIQPSEVPVFVLCGGLGTRFREQTEFRPKPMILIGDHPILWHILRTYSAHGFRKFVLCVGYKAEVIKAYFLSYHSFNADFTVDLATNHLTIHSVDHADNWQVTLADTGVETMTGGRIARAAARYLGDAEHFAVTYGDGLTDADLTAELEFHLAQQRVGTVLGINPPSRFGEIQLTGNQVRHFDEKPAFKTTWINGGYFLFQRKFLEYLSPHDSCVLEQDPLARLAEDGQLSMYKHDGYWACMDTQRDHDDLNARWERGEAPWRV